MSSPQEPQNLSQQQFLQLEAYRALGPQELAARKHHTELWQRLINFGAVPLGAAVTLTELALGEHVYAAIAGVATVASAGFGQAFRRHVQLERLAEQGSQLPNQ